MACCMRPGWTMCFFFVWLTIAPGAYYTHLSLFDLLPYLKDLPANIVKGFDETFKFAYLEQDSKKIEAASAAALLKCGVVANVSCPNNNYSWVSPSQSTNTTKEQAIIAESFETTLNVVNKVANDKYFGVAELRPTADSLNEIVNYVKQLNDTMKCAMSTPLFCGIHTSAQGIVAGIGEVNQAIDSFKSSDMVEQFEDYQKFLILLHALPYIMVVALMFFTCFWMKGGVLCCCKGGTKCTLALIPFVLFWLLSFGIYAVVLGMGVGFKYHSDKLNVPVLNGNPNLEQALDHIETEYPAFWSLVFASLVHGLNLLLRAAFLFVVASICIALYSCCECLCCPYRKTSEEKAKAEQP